MYHKGTNETVCTITALSRHSHLHRHHCDPVVIKIDERKKLINYPKVYLLLKFEGSRQEKESMKTETAALARQRETTWKERERP